MSLDHIFTPPITTTAHHNNNNTQNRTKLLHPKHTSEFLSPSHPTPFPHPHSTTIAFSSIPIPPNRITLATPRHNVSSSLPHPTPSPHLHSPILPIINPHTPASPPQPPLPLPTISSPHLLSPFTHHHYIS